MYACLVFHVKNRHGFALIKARFPVAAPGTVGFLLVLIAMHEKKILPVAFSYWKISLLGVAIKQEVVMLAAQLAPVGAAITDLAGEHEGSRKFSVSQVGSTLVSRPIVRVFCIERERD